MRRTVALLVILLGVGRPAGQRSAGVPRRRRPGAFRRRGHRQAGRADPRAQGRGFRDHRRAASRRNSSSSPAVSPVSAPPLHLGFMIDNSGSMIKDIADVRTAAIKFLNRVENITDVTVADFDTEVRVARFGPDDFPRLIERIRSRKPDGYTALYDALGRPERRRSPPHARGASRPGRAAALRRVRAGMRPAAAALRAMRVRAAWAGAVLDSRFRGSTPPGRPRRMRGSPGTWWWR